MQLENAGLAAGSKKAARLAPGLWVYVGGSHDKTSDPSLRSVLAIDQRGLSFVPSRQPPHVSSCLKPIPLRWRHGDHSSSTDATFPSLHEMKVITSRSAVLARQVIVKLVEVVVCPERNDARVWKQANTAKSETQQNLSTNQSVSSKTPKKSWQRRGE